MKICVVGCGMQGSVAARDLKESGHNVTALDNNVHRLRALRTRTAIKAQKFDVKDKKTFITYLKDFDIVVGALPAALGYYTMECAVCAGVDIVDMSYSEEDPFALHSLAKKAKVRIVPDAGFAPGLSNILIGEAYQEFRGIDSLRILVGGIPQHPEPPFNYQITWSPSDLIEEYTRPTRIMKNRRIVYVQTLSCIEEFSVPRIGRLECFYTDGLRTLLKSLKDVKNMEEKTIRYPGHARLIKALIDADFFIEKPVRIGKKYVTIKDVNSGFLQKILMRGDNRDLSILIIDIKKGTRKRNYTCIDFYDEKNKVTSMARMTAYTGSVIAQCIKEYPDYGVVPPEYLGMNEKIFAFIRAELKKRNVTIRTKQ